MSDFLGWPSLGGGSRTPYFPPLYGAVECGECKREDCPNRGKFQRNRRDFTWTSGRCPRLPDMRGHVAEDERFLYERTFPLVLAEPGDSNGPHLSLKLPDGRRRILYYNKTYKRYWFRDSDDDGEPVKRIVTPERSDTPEELLDLLTRRGWTSLLMRCQVNEECL